MDLGLECPSVRPPVTLRSNFNKEAEGHFHHTVKTIVSVDNRSLWKFGVGSMQRDMTQGRGGRKLQCVLADLIQ